MVIANDAETTLDGTAYRFGSVIARGRLSTVVLAERLRDRLPVVVKLLPEGDGDLGELAERLRLEAEALSHLVHPNVVRVLDSGTTAAGVPFLVMERLVGRTLGAELELRGELPLDEALELICQALAGLGAAHAVGIVHRDVKPANLFVCDAEPRRILKVLDFGIAKALGEAELLGLRAKPHTQEGVRLGTPRFIAPEQVRAGLVSPATDVYAAGLVLYQMLVGRHPFAEHRSIDQLYRAHLLEMPPAPSSRARQAIPPAIDRAVLRAIAKNPADRFDDARAFAAELTGSKTALAPDSRSARTSIGDETMATEPPRGVAAPRATETSAVLVGLVSGIDFLWRLASMAGAVPHLIDPLGRATELWGRPRAGSEDAVSLLSRLAALADLARGGVLAIASGALLLLAIVALSRKSRGAFASFVPWAFAAIALGLVLDLASLGLRGAVLTEIDAPLVAGVGYSIGVLATLVVPVVQTGSLLVLRRFSRQS